jgi:hypothetical protein
MNSASIMYKCGQTTFTLIIMYRRKQIIINILRFDINILFKFKAKLIAFHFHKFWTPIADFGYSL